MIARFFVALIVITASNVAYPWSQSVHNVAGETVFQRLSKEERRYFSKLAQAISGDVRYFRDMSSWVDSVRSMPVQELFEGDVPAALSPFARRHSSEWHYENNPYFPKHHHRACSIDNTGKLEEAFSAIDTALQEQTSVRQEAILIAFAIHLLEDIHQPLHTNSLARNDCSLDRGGNLYCLQKYADKCVMNLHQLWDGAFGLGKDLSFWRTISAGQPKDRPIHFDISLALVEGRDVIEGVYKAQENRAPRAEYLKWARAEAELRTTLMVQRVTAYLKTHHARKKEAN